MEVRQIDAHTLDINGIAVQFDQRVFSFLIMENKVIVLLHVNDFELGDEMVGRNVLAHNDKGEMIWRVGVHGFRRDDAPEAFFEIWLEDDGRLMAGTPAIDFSLDPETGEYLTSERRF
jgi:hypothetical protein